MRGRRRDDLWDWRDSIVLALAAVFFVLAIVSFAAAQTVTERDLAAVLREIDRLQVQVDHLVSSVDTERANDARIRLDGFTRLAAVEAEVKLTGRLIYGTVAGFFAQALLTGLGLRRLSRMEKTLNGRDRE